LSREYLTVVVRLGGYHRLGSRAFEAEETMVATYVLVPGAWLGGWAWRKVATRLREAGHEVYPVTLTGLGERIHLAHPDVNLETHIADVTNVLTWNDLHDVILVGHSYAGIVVTGVADRIPERIATVVYLDSAPLADGQAMTDLYPPEALAAVEQEVTEQGDGWRWPFPGFARLGQDASLRGLDGADRAWMEAKAAPQPWATYTRSLRVQQEERGTYERVAIACDDVRGLVGAGIPPIVAMTQPPWRYLELDTGHWPMFSAPDRLAGMLADLAGV
jgi:pimeloyl-ACP methyl ester carboxylesterase